MQTKLILQKYFYDTLLTIKFIMQNILGKQTYLSQPSIYCQVKEKTEDVICEQPSGLIKSNSHILQIHFLGWTKMPMIYRNCITYIDISEVQW